MAVLETARLHVFPSYEYAIVLFPAATHMKPFHAAAEDADTAALVDA
jgi:hypothetical protein